MIDLATCPPPPPTSGPQTRTRTLTATDCPPAFLDIAPPSSLNVIEPPDSDPLLALEAKDLLTQFAATGKQAPFEEIVRRYSGMVFNVCLEVTNNRHDAEDATQAAFLSLAIQARSGQQVIAIGPWLQQVARRMSLDINRSRKRRKNREDRHSHAWEARKIDTHDTVSGAANGAPPETAAKWDELRGIIQEELAALPAKYRMPLILHYYGGMGREEMAKELNCRTNTLGVRLHRAREMLGKRLAKRGVALSGVVVGLYLVEIVRSAVSHQLVAHTAQAAALLAAGKSATATALVSGPVIELAHTAGRVVATAKFKLAAMLALVAGAAAAAGSEAMHHFQIDLPAKIRNFDFGRLFRPLWRSNAPTPINGPSLPNVGGPVASDDAKSQKTGGSGSGAERSSDTLVGGPGRANLDWPDWVTIPPSSPQLPPPSLPRNTGSAIAEKPLPPANRAAPDGDGRLPPPNSATANNRSGKDGVRAPSGEGGGNNSGSSVAKRDKDRPEKDRDDSPERDRRHVDKKDHRDNREDEKMPPGRGGVKHPERPSTHVEGPGSDRPGPNSPPSDDKAPKPNRHGPGHNPADPKIGPVNPFDGGHANQGNPPPVGPPPTGPSQGGPPPGDHANQQDLGVDPNAPITPEGGVRDPETGRLLISSNLTSSGEAPGLSRILTGAPSQALFRQNGGDVVNREVFVGFEGTGAIMQSAGRHTVDSLFIGATGQSTGLAQISGGQLLVTRSTADASHVIEIGGAGEGELRLGGAFTKAEIAETGDGEGGGVSMVIGSTRMSRGTLHGWGKVHLSGTLTNNGKVIADGFGRRRTLNLGSFSNVFNDHDNRTGGEARGWYAQNGGKLSLPAMAVQPRNTAQSFNWGEDASDDTIDLVNSARVTFGAGAIDGPAQMSISLLSLDREDLPALPSGHTLIGAWSFDLTGEDGADVSAAGGVDLQVRYDHLLAGQLGLDEGVLKMWTFGDGQWVRHDFDSDFLRDPGSHTLSAHVDGHFTHFAVSAPEPGVMGIAVIGLSMCLGRRRRRN